MIPSIDPYATTKSCSNVELKKEISESDTLGNVEQSADWRRLELWNRGKATEEVSMLPLLSQESFICLDTWEWFFIKDNQIIRL